MEQPVTRGPNIASLPDNTVLFKSKPVPHVSFSPLRPRPQDILYPGESDDDTFEVQQVKTKHRERIAREYLQQQPGYLITSRLRGPFQTGWNNPWANSMARKERRNAPSSKGNAHLKTRGRDLSSPIDLTSDLEEAAPTSPQPMPVFEPTGTATVQRAPVTSHKPGGGWLTSNLHKVKAPVGDSHKILSPTPHQRPSRGITKQMQNTPAGREPNEVEVPNIVPDNAIKIPENAHNHNVTRAPLVGDEQVGHKTTVSIGAAGWDTLSKSMEAYPAERVKNMLAKPVDETDVRGLLEVDRYGMVRRLHVLDQKLSGGLPIVPPMDREQLLSERAMVDGIIDRFDQFVTESKTIWDTRKINSKISFEQHPDPFKLQSTIEGSDQAKSEQRRISAEPRQYGSQLQNVVSSQVNCDIQPQSPKNAVRVSQTSPLSEHAWTKRQRKRARQKKSLDTRLGLRATGEEVDRVSFGDILTSPVSERHNTQESLAVGDNRPAEVSSSSQAIAYDKGLHGKSRENEKPDQSVAFDVALNKAWREDHAELLLPQKSSAPEIIARKAEPIGDKHHPSTQTASCEPTKLVTRTPQKLIDDKAMLKSKQVDSLPSKEISVTDQSSTIRRHKKKRKAETLLVTETSSFSSGQDSLEGFERASQLFRGMGSLFARDPSDPVPASASSQPMNSKKRQKVSFYSASQVLPASTDLPEFQYKRRTGKSDSSKSIKPAASVSRSQSPLKNAEGPRQLGPRRTGGNDYKIAVQVPLVVPIDHNLQEWAPISIAKDNFVLREKLSSSVGDARDQPVTQRRSGQRNLAPRKPVQDEISRTEESSWSYTTVRKTGDGGTGEDEVVVADVVQEAQVVSNPPMQLHSVPSTNLIETDRQPLKYSTDKDESLSTQAEFARAQRSLWGDLESPVKRHHKSLGSNATRERDSSKSLSSRAADSTSNAIGASPRPKIGNIAAARLGEEYEEPMNTQALVDAMSPFNVSTVKKNGGFFSALTKPAAAFMGFMRGSQNFEDEESAPTSSNADDAMEIDDNDDEDGGYQMSQDQGQALSQALRVDTDMTSSSDSNESNGTPIRQQVRPSAQSQISANIPLQTSQSKKDKINPSSSRRSKAIEDDEESDFETTLKESIQGIQARDLDGRFSGNALDSISTPANKMSLRSLSTLGSQQQNGQRSSGVAAVDAIAEAGSYLGEWNLDTEMKNLSGKASSRRR